MSAQQAKYKISLIVADKNTYLFLIFVGRKELIAAVKNTFLLSRFDILRDKYIKWVDALASLELW